MSEQCFSNSGTQDPQEGHEQRSRFGCEQSWSHVAMQRLTQSPLAPPLLQHHSDITAARVMPNATSSNGHAASLAAQLSRVRSSSPESPKPRTASPPAQICTERASYPELSQTISQASESCLLACARTLANAYCLAAWCPMQSQLFCWSSSGPGCRLSALGQHHFVFHGILKMFERCMYHLC